MAHGTTHSWTCNWQLHHRLHFELFNWLSWPTNGLLTYHGTEYAVISSNLPATKLNSVRLIQILPSYSVPNYQSKRRRAAQPGNTRIPSPVIALSPSSWILLGSLFRSTESLFSLSCTNYEAAHAGSHFATTSRAGAVQYPLRFLCSLPSMHALIKFQLFIMGL